MQNKPAHIAPNRVDKRKDVCLFGSLGNAMTTIREKTNRHKNI